MRHGNRSKQLLCLPGKTMSLVGPHVCWSRRGCPSQEHSSPAGSSVLQTLNVAGLPSGGKLSHLINLVSCPLPHTGSVQRSSLMLIGSVKVVVTRPLSGSTDLPA